MKAKLRGRKTPGSMYLQGSSQSILTAYNPMVSEESLRDFYADPLPHTDWSSRIVRLADELRGARYGGLHAELAGAQHSPVQQQALHEQCMCHDHQGLHRLG